MYIILWLSAAPRSVNSQMEMIDIKVLERGDDWQCASIEERERARNEINIISNQVIANVTGCNGTPGWRHVAFINMTDTSYNCLTSHHIPRQEDMWTITHNCRVFINHIQCWRLTIQPGVWEDKGIPVWGN